MNCDFITRFGLAVLCDGSVTCHHHAAYNKENIGNVKINNLDEIWHGDKLNGLRQNLKKNITPVHCTGCPFLKDEALGLIRQYPIHVWFESTILCNLRCPQECCIKLNGNPLNFRKTVSWNLDEFTQYIVPYVKHLEQFLFYNYGDAFLNPELPSMIAAIRKVNPTVVMFASTNGMLMSDELINSLVTNQFDRILISIDGAIQEHYEKYRINGNLGQILNNVDRLHRIKVVNNSVRPILHWRYILFNWNDSWLEMKRALWLAEQHNFNQFSWEITTTPHGKQSHRFVPGAPSYLKIKQDIWDGSPEKNALLHKKSYKYGFSDIKTYLHSKIDSFGLHF